MSIQCHVLYIHSRGGGACSHPGAGESYSLVSHIKLSIVNANEHVTEDPEGVTFHVQTLETTDTDRRTLLQGKWVFATMERGVAHDDGKGVAHKLGVSGF